jgi:signal transduction histidine kinase/CheY-like chemotaxis protein
MTDPATPILGFPKYYLVATHLALLLSAWMLVGLFAHLGRYSKRDSFGAWTLAWAFFAGWLTLGILEPYLPVSDWIFVIRQWSLGTAAVLLLWGSLRSLEVPVPKTLLVLFSALLLVWAYVGGYLKRDSLVLQLPVFLTFCAFSLFVASGNHWLGRGRPSWASRLLAVGILLWGGHLVCFPLTEHYESLRAVQFLGSTVLQLYVAVTMILVLLEQMEQRREPLAPCSEPAPTEATKPPPATVEPPPAGRDWESAYRELRNSQPALLRKQRLQAMSQMSVVIVHDLSNLLSPIVTYSEHLLNQSFGLDERAKHYLHQINVAGEDITRLVERMREFYRRREWGPAQPVDLNRLVQPVLEQTRSQWRDALLMQGIRVEISQALDEHLPPLQGYDNQLQEALTNLVLNAVDALPRGGKIEIATGFTPQAPGDPPGTTAHAWLEVRDNGTGMDEHVRQHCLEPFFTTKGNRGGRGLGLATVYGTMERHDGRIEIETRQDHGTKVRLVFPIRESPKTAVVPSPQVQLAPPGALRILCVDDEPVICEALKLLLEGKGHLVVSVCGGLSALETFRQARLGGKPFDAVVTDLAMPGVDGREVTESIKAESPQTPVVLLTGYGTAEIAEEDGEPLPVDGVLSKPPRIEELSRMLTQLTQKPILEKAVLNPIGPEARN